MKFLNTSFPKTLYHSLIVLGVVSTGLLSIPSIVQAQNHWHWIDAQGRHVFSDKAPPSNIPDKNILGMPKLPANLMDGAAADYAAADKAAADKAAAATAKTSAQAAADAKAKEQQEQQKIAQQRQESCNRAKQALTVLNAGVKIAQPDGKGGVSSMNDAQMAQERKRIQDVISKDCGSGNKTESNATQS